MTAFQLEISTDYSREGAAKGDYSRLAAKLAPLALLIACAAGYSSCIFSGFACDDFDNVNYYLSMLNGHPELFIKTLTSCVLQDPLYGMHYRPFLQLSFILDAFVWKANPAGWHATNFLLHWCCTVAVFVAGLQLLKDLASPNSATDVPREAMHSGSRHWWTAFSAALLFAVTPLHTETVNWIVARVDSLVCLFHLAALYCYLRGLQKPGFWRITGPVLFLFSLCIKEAGLVLPMVLTVFTSLQGNSIKRSLIKTAPYWVCAAAFLIARTLALGMLIGGYLTCTEHLSVSIFKNFLSLQFLKYLLIPVPTSDLGALLPQVVTLVFGYFLLLITFIRTDGHRLREHRKVFMFLFAWFALLLCPVAPIFIPFQDMLCNRLLYTPSIAVCLILAAAGFCNARWKLSLPALCAVGLAYVNISAHSCYNWSRADEESKSIGRRMTALLSANQHRQVTLVDLPRSIHGVHIHYLIKTLKQSLCPPFTSERPADLTRLYALEPTWYIEPGIVNLSSLREFTASGAQLHDIQTDESGELRICRLPGIVRRDNATVVFDEASISVTGAKEISHLTFHFNPPICPAELPLLMIDFLSKPECRCVYLYIKTPGEIDYSPKLSNTFRSPIITGNKMLIHTGELKNWSAQPSIDRLCVSIPGRGAPLRPLKATFLSDETMVPRVAACQLKVRDDNVKLSGPGVNKIWFEYDASKIPEAAGIKVELSSPYDRFIYGSGTYRDTKLSSRTKNCLDFSGSSGRFSVSRDSVQQIGYPCWYSLRIFARNRAGQLVGLSSDPIYISFEEPLH